MPISRTYDTAEAAAAAVHDLEQAGFSESHIATHEDGKGGHRVTVSAPYGYGAFAESVLHGGTEDGSSHVSHGSHAEPGADDPAPLSSALGLPTLSHNPAPLSSLFGWRTLSAAQNPKSDKLLSHNPTPFSSMLGLPVLINKAAVLGYHQGKHNPAPLSSMLGLKLLSNDPAPLSHKMGWKTLSSDPAPLSHKLGVKVLSEDQ